MYRLFPQKEKKIDDISDDKPETFVPDIGYDPEILGPIYSNRMLSVESFRLDNTGANSSYQWVKSIEGDYTVLIRVRSGALQMSSTVSISTLILFATINSSSTDSSRTILLTNNDYIMLPSTMERIFFEVNAATNTQFGVYVSIICFNDYIVQSR